MKKILFLFVSFFIVLCIYLAFASSVPLPVYVAEKVEELSEPDQEKIKPILFLGDVMLGRYVETLMKNKDFDPFGDTTDFLKYHTTIANLEGPIPEIHKKTPSNGFTFSFPLTTPKYLYNHGVQAVSLSNNHSFDHGVHGYEYTKMALEKEGVSHFGGYRSDVSDYFETNLGTTTVIVFGVNMISSLWSEKSVLDTVKLLRQNHPKAYIISFVHWGNEYNLKQGKVQQVFAHTLIDNGVNAIVGSHPHVVQGVELYKDSPIFYSLGNFIFDQYFSEETQEGYMLSLNKKDNTLIFSLIPIVSKQSITNVASAILSTKILNIIAKSSQEELRGNIQKGQIVLPFH